MRTYRNQRGYLLITVVITLFLLASIALLLASDSSISANTSSRELETARAEYVAQAGLQHALWRTANNACMGDLAIPNTALGADSYSATVSGAAAGTLYTLPADQDAWIRSDDITRNNGTTVSNHIRQELGNVEQILTRFDVSTIPAGAKINSAIAWFHLKAGKTHPEGPINVHEITADWVETAVTWESFAASYRGGRVAMLPAQEAGDVWVAISLTGLVQSWVNGQPNYGILFDTPAEGIHTEYTAREDGSNPARLEVVVGSGDASPVSIKAKGNLDNGVSRILKDKTAATYQPPGTVVLQLGDDPGADAMLDSFYPRNYGGRDFVQVNEPAGDWVQRPVFKFDVGSVPAGARVESAQLELRMRTVLTPGVASIHRVNRSWVEGTKSGTGSADGATWATHDGTGNWASEGGDFNAAAVAETTIAATDTWVSWEIGPLVERWLAGEPNYGLLLKSDGVLKEAEFYSKEETDATLRPKLTIKYACECGTPCMALRGTGRIALIGDDGAPDPDDQLKIQIIESWGYEVDFYQDLDSDGINWSNYDLAYVSETSVSSDINANLTDLAVGIVNEEPKLYDDLLLANGDTEHVGSSIDIADNSHFITSVFPPGPLPIYTGDMEILTADAPLAGGLQALGEFSGAAALTATDAGAQTTTGTAAGRRVTLPFGQHFAAGFDWTNLNHNGHLLVQRAIDWGMNADAVVVGGVLMVVGNDSALTTQEQAKITLIESWGYTVNVIDEDDPQSSFDTAFASNDVVFVTEDVNASDVNTKLNAATIGVVTEEVNLSDDLGLSSGIDWDSGTVLGILNNDHYITSGFALGPLTVLSTSESIAYLSGTESPDLRKLSRSTSGMNIATLDAGAATWSGGIVAGRRAILPWGGNDMDVANLTADGLTLFQRALEWGAGIGVSGKPLLFVVTDATSPVADEIERQALVESWGYAVTRISDEESQANFDAAVSVNDVVYISGDALYNNIGIKLADAAIGVVYESYQLNNEFGLSPGGIALANLQSITIIDNSHYITSPYSGSVTITTSNQRLSSVSSYDFGTQMQLLASIPSYEGAIATFDTGDVDHYGDIVAGRRVKLPWGDTDWGFEFNSLSTDGQKILRRSLEWASGAAGGGPIAHWKLDDGTGTTAIDSEGGHDGTVVNGPVWVAGNLGDALQFDGSNDYVDLTSDPELDDIFVGGATVMAWIEPASWGDNGYGRIFDKSTSPSSTGDGWAIRVNKDNGGLNFGQGFTGGRGWWKFAEGSINFGAWHHVALAYDASSTANDPTVYLDGSPVTVTRVDSPSGDVRSDASINLHLGNHASSSSTFFDGKIDDARIYKGMLGGSEIAALAGTSSVLPIAHWKMDETSGTTAIDSVGGHDGALINGPSWSAGQIDGALDFDGANDYVNVPHDDTLSLTDKMTFTAWINASSFGTTYQTILAKDAGDAGSNYWFGTWQKLFVFGLFSNGFFREVFDPDFELQPGTWYHLAASFDNVTGTTNLYVDGSLVAHDALGFHATAVTADLRLGVSPDGERWRGLLDDVRIYDEVLTASEIAALAGVGGGGGGGGGDGTCDGTFRDEFNAASFGNNDGTLSWADDWLEVGESDGPSSGDVRIRDDVGPYQLWIRDNNNGGEGVERESNLDGASSATLSFIYRRSQLDNENDYVKVEISSNGTAGPWTELERFKGPGTDTGYSPFSMDISAHTSANTRIRLISSPTMGNTDLVIFDNIEISCTP